MVEVSAGALAARLRAAVDAQGRVAQAAQDQAEQTRADRDAEPTDAPEDQPTGEEPEA